MNTEVMSCFSRSALTGIASLLTCAAAIVTLTACCAGDIDEMIIFAAPGPQPELDPECRWEGVNWGGDTSLQTSDAIMIEQRPM